MQYITWWDSELHFQINNLFFIFCLSCPHGKSLWWFCIQNEPASLCLWLLLQFLHIFSPCFSTGIGKDNDCFETVVEQGNREQWWRNVDGGVTMATGGQRVFQLWESKHIFHHCFFSEFWAALVTFRVRDKSANSIWHQGAVPSLQKLKSSWESHTEIQTGVQVKTFSRSLCYWIV